MSLKVWAMVVVGGMGVWPLVSVAQSPFDAASQAPGGQAELLGGAFTSDVIVLQAQGPGVPLRFGGILQGTERVEFEGQVLKRGTDYSMDYAAGVVYLMRAQRAGQTLRVSYRHDAARPSTSEAAQRPFAGFKYDLMPGGLKMIVGFGMTERRNDGSVLSTNQFGIDNSYSMGSASIKGLFLVGEKQQQNARSVYEYQKSAIAPDSGRSQFLLQNVQAKLGGGTVEAGYQEISKNFTGFGAVADAGYDKEAVNQLQKERGLVRTSLSMKDVGVGDFKLSNGYRAVEDEKGSIEWRNYGFAVGGLSMNYDSQRVDSNFQRFKDLGEKERDQLKKEVGLTRENIAGSYKSQFGNLNFGESTIEDVRGNAITRRTLGLDAGKFKFDMGSQEIDQGFNRFQSLFDKERQQYGPEAGLSRQWMSVEAEMFRGTPIKFASSSVDSKTGSFSTRDIAATGNGWSLEHAARGVDPGFGSLNVMPDAEVQGHIKAIAGMYEKDVKYKPEEKNLFIRGVGIDRSMTRLSAQPFKGWNASFEHLKLQGQKDGGEVNSFALGGKDFSATYRAQTLGAQFSEIGQLMNFEKQRLGMVAGLDRSDFGLNFKVGTAKIAASQMVASTAEGSANRQTVSVQGPTLDVTVSTRKVDAGFTSSQHLIDPERDLLGSLKGFDQRDIKAKWKLLPNLEIEALWFDANSDAFDQERMKRDTIIRYQPDKQTEIAYAKQQQKHADPLKLLFSNVTERLSVSRNFGRFGTLRYLTETREYDGLLANVPDSTKRYLSYETKLDPRTSLKTEQTITQFDNGEKENIQANTVSTELSKGAGVSVTQVDVDRAGDERDEKKRNYGFWVDLGGGVRFSYGYARHLAGEQASTEKLQMGLTPGTIGGVQVGQTNYAENRWDDSRMQSFGNVQLATARPITLGFLSNVKLNFGVDTAADKSNWLKENRLVSFTGNVGKMALGYEYKSQIHPTGTRGIDRLFSFATDQDENAPFRASVKYKVRTLPWDEQVMIRDYSFTAKPAKNVSLTHQLLTNPEVAKGDAILGSITQASRVNRWKLDVKNSPDVTIGGTWDELINDQSHTRARTGGLNVSLFGSTGSPLQLYYGIEQNDTNGVRRTTNRYHIRYDQKAGPNQVFSVFAGNVSYQHTIANGQSRNNLSVRLDYQIKF